MTLFRSFRCRCTCNKSPGATSNPVYSLFCPFRYLIYLLHVVQFYSAGYTNDLRSALIYISSTFPNAPLHGLGFSLGANVLTRYLGEEGEMSRLRSGLALACVSFLSRLLVSFMKDATLSYILIRLFNFILLPSRGISKRTAGGWYRMLLQTDCCIREILILLAFHFY